MGDLFCFECTKPKPTFLGGFKCSVFCFRICNTVLLLCYGLLQQWNIVLDLNLLFGRIGLIVRVYHVLVREWKDYKQSESLHAYLISTNRNVVCCHFVFLCCRHWCFPHCLSFTSLPISLSSARHMRFPSLNQTIGLCWCKATFPVHLFTTWQSNLAVFALKQPTRTLLQYTPWMQT